MTKICNTLCRASNTTFVRTVPSAVTERRRVNPSDGARTGGHVDLKHQRYNAFIASDGGFTSIGVVIALLLVVTLLFSAVQVRWIQSQSADIQFVADAGALAAGNVVGEYTVLVRVADAVVLSMSLFGMAVFGIAVVVSCIPFAQSVGATLMDFGHQVFKARDKCADGVANALNSLQNALPFIAAVNSAATISSNNSMSASSNNYLGLAILMPLAGQDVVFSSDDQAQASGDVIGEKNRQTGNLTDTAQEAYQQMQSSKLEGYLADCGNNPAYCLYERVDTLSSLDGARNPYFSSVDSWLFDYAFARSRDYYQSRLAAERPLNSTLDEQVRSLCRQRYYSYACQQMAKGWCMTASDGTLNAYFPLMPKNNAEVRQTVLYTESVYPVSIDGIIHGSFECPGYLDAGTAKTGSVAELEDGVYQKCPHCGFDINSIGRVGSASSSVNNGFEYHYRKVASAAERYQLAAEEYQDRVSGAKESAKEGFNAFEQALESLKSTRLSAWPPGRNGVLSIVIDPSSSSLPPELTNSSVNTAAQLQPRIAISACALASEKALSGSNIISEFLERAKSEASGQNIGAGALGVFDSILDVWGSVLTTYSNGQEALIDGLENFLGSLPLIKSTPLARWAKTALVECFNTFGIQGADLSASRPLLVNSLHVLKASDMATTKTLLNAKQAYSSLPGSGSGSIESSLIDGLLGEARNKGSSYLAGSFTLFEISFGDFPGLPTIPIRLTLPKSATQRAQALLDSIMYRARQVFGRGGDNAVWE
ncbi:MAG: hypothetical protein LBU07_05645 [Coriobacteriales bacterium]|jgi:hypothetical protein|nr:hypothetical protein [Coriobacteriales bacterium]